MKFGILFSCALHIGLWAALVFSRTSPSKFDGYPTTIPVEIVELKPVSFKAPEVEKVAPKPRKLPPKREKLEGVTVEKPKITEEKIKVETEKPKIAEEPQKESEGKSAAEGEKVKLDVDEFPFSYYLALLKSRINVNWEPPFGAIGKAVVFFKIQRNGQIVNIALEGKSGDFLFDQAALRAVSLANPLPPLPFDFKEAFLGVHFEFEQGRN